MTDYKIDFKQNLKDWYDKLKNPVAKGRRELLGDITYSFMGLLVGYLAIRAGGIAMLCGILLIGMVIILFFTPEKQGF